jgi:hypothetical protein
MAKRISSGERKPRRAPTRRRTDKPVEAAPAEGIVDPVPAESEPTPEVRGAESPGSLAGEAATSGLMTSSEGQVAIAGSATERSLAATVAHAASSPEVWGTEARPDRAAVARRAFELFLARGGKHGHDVEDWLAAERELQQGLGQARRSVRT